MDQRDPGMLGPTEARLEIPEVGICGTDRKVAVFEHGAPPARTRSPKFVEIGDLVEPVEPRNLVVPTVRRPCSHSRCVACRGGRPDCLLHGRLRRARTRRATGFLSE